MSGSWEVQPLFAMPSPQLKRFPRRTAKSWCGHSSKFLASYLREPCSAACQSSQALPQHSYRCTTEEAYKREMARLEELRQVGEGIIDVCRLHMPICFNDGKWPLLGRARRLREGECPWWGRGGDRGQARARLDVAQWAWTYMSVRSWPSTPKSPSSEVKPKLYLQVQIILV